MVGTAQPAMKITTTIKYNDYEITIHGRSIDDDWWSAKACV
jgi:hypothetical protein